MKRVLSWLHYDARVMRFQRRSASMLLPLVFMCSGCSVGKPKVSDNAPAAVLAKNAAPKYHYFGRRTIDGYSTSSPARAVLEFWWDVQNQDLLRAYEALSPTFQAHYGKGLTHFSTRVMADYSHWLGIQPAVVAEQVSANAATVVFKYTPPGLPPGNPFTFSLVRQSGQWKIAYNFYLVNRLTAS